MSRSNVEYSISLAFRDLEIRVIDFLINQLLLQSHPHSTSCPWRSVRTHASETSYRSEMLLETHAACPSVKLAKVAFAKYFFAIFVPIIASFYHQGESVDCGL